jgi:hypothetical protein
MQAALDIVPWTPRMAGTLNVTVGQITARGPAVRCGFDGRLAVRIGGTDPDFSAASADRRG